jgi:hypothetical protein
MSADAGWLPLSNEASLAGARVDDRRSNAMEQPEIVKRPRIADNYASRRGDHHCG